MLVTRKRISTTLGLLALLAAGAAPSLAVPPGPNQSTADAVAGTLARNSALASSPIDIEVVSGQVTLTGSVASPALKAQAAGLARQVPGVQTVVDRLSVVGDPRVRPAQFEMSQPQPTQVAMGLHGHGGMAHGGMGHGGMAHGGAIYDGGGGVGMPIDAGMMGPGMGFDGGPLPEGPALPGATQAAQPGYPNYAWPSYAPYPNFSAVGYPTVYPWQAWPNIGPFYPYPEVPLGWRAVTLRWDDGLWWLDFKKHYTRPFFTPYPFGLKAY